MSDRAGAKGMEGTDTLTDKQRRFCELYASGLESRVAARSAGYSESFSKVAAHRLGKNPAVAQAIAAIQKEGMRLAVYDLVTAMAEAQAVCDFAIKHKNAMAYMKGTELRAKLSGLLIDRVEIATIDLTGALARAEARVLNVGTHDGRDKCAINWHAQIPGAGENPEAGPAPVKSDA